MEPFASFHSLPPERRGRAQTAPTPVVVAISRSDYAMIREFAAATHHAPYVEVEMKALLEGSTSRTSEMMRFQRHDQI